MNLYPYLGAGVRVSYPKDDPNTIVVRMGLHWWNRNLYGTQFGGTLYSMCDPFFVFILVRNMGPDYLVGDKDGGRVVRRRRGRCARDEASLGGKKGLTCAHR